MTRQDWTRAPVEQTCPVRRVVLAVVHTVAAGQRVLDGLAVLEGEPGVQVVFTHPSAATGSGVPGFLRDSAGLVIPWRQAVVHGFDLIVSGSARYVGALTGPLVLLPDLSTQPDFPDTPGLDGVDSIRRALNPDSGMRVPRASSVVALAHYEQRDALLTRWPGAARHAVVVGDPAFDRLVASLPERDRYREALGAGPGDRVVLAVSTRGRHSLIGKSAPLLSRLLAEVAGPGTLVAGCLHPDVWDSHGQRQVLAWTADLRRAGLRLRGPADDWRVPLVAADYVVGDHGMVTAYAAAVGKPVLLAHPLRSHLVPGSPAEALAAVAPVIDPTAALAGQLERVARPVDGGVVAERVTSLPRRSAAVLRASCYRALRLPEPATPTTDRPVPVGRNHQ